MLWKQSKLESDRGPLLECEVRTKENNDSRTELNEKFICIDTKMKIKNVKYPYK